MSGMSPEVTFYTLNALSFIAWVLLVVAPQHKLTKELVRGYVIPVVLAASYTCLLVYVGRTVQITDFSFGSLLTLGSDPWAVTLLWAHVLCFDLLAGIWMTADAELRGISRKAVLVPLILTFFAGPLGLLVYLLMPKVGTLKRRIK